MSYATGFLTYSVENLIRIDLGIFELSESVLHISINGVGKADFKVDEYGNLRAVDSPRIVRGALDATDNRFERQGGFDTCLYHLTRIQKEKI